VYTGGEVTARKTRKYPRRAAVERVAEASPSRVPKLTSKHMKSFRLAADKIKRARKVLGTKTDTGTIEAALDMVIFRQELLDGLGAMSGAEFTSPESMDLKRS
jgi:hypothetical protein